MKHALLEYERNGYDDSDFFCVYFDDATNTIGQQEIGSTRYAGGLLFTGIHRHGAKANFPADVLEAARKALANHIFSVISAAEHRDVLTPNPANIPFGTKVRVTENSSKRAKKNHFSAGEVGEVYWSGAFGTFYRNGYNRPNRENTSVGIRTLNGGRVFVPLTKLRLDREPLSDTELRERAEALSHHYNFGACCAGFTWESERFFNTPKN